MAVNTFAMESDLSCSPLPTVGGYDYEFVETPPKACGECLVCRKLLTLRDPHLLSCPCGAKTCHSCVSKIVNVEEENSTTLLIDEKLQCSKNSQGCTWMGKLRHLESDISPLDDGDCPLACSYRCGQVMNRVDMMTDHEENYRYMCPNFPNEIKLAKLQSCIKKYEIELDQRKAVAAKLNQQLQIQGQMAEQKKYKNILQDMSLKVDEFEMKELKLEIKMTNQSNAKTTSFYIVLPAISSGSDPSEITQPRCSPHDINDSCSAASDSSTIVPLYDFNFNVLLLMSKFKSAPVGLKYNLEQGRVEIMAADPEQLKQMVNSFQESYQLIIQNPQLKSETLELPPTANAECTTRLVDQCNDNYHQCYLSYDAATHSVKIVALSSYEYDQAIKLLKQGTTRQHKTVTSITINSPPSYGLATHKSPICDDDVKLRKGNQPYGTMNHKIMCYPRLQGYPKCNTILITYHFPSGIQGGNHPKPGKSYSGTTRTAYLPHNNEGRHVLKMLRKAFDAGLLFTIVKSSISWKVTWIDDIEHKENTYGGRIARGYPDETYLKRVEEKLKAMGVTTDECGAEQ